MMNHTIPIVKSQSSSYKSHLTPIAPAPINLAPKPVHVLPKPASLNENQNQQNNDHLETQSLPCVITSKQWVLPPRPKAGRKPSEKKKLTLPNNTQPPPHSNVSKLSSNLTNLNLYKSQSENINLKDTDLKNQLETATEENQKLKNIISRLKAEIESLQATQQHHLVQQPPPLPQNQAPIQPLQQSFQQQPSINSAAAAAAASQEVSTPINTMSTLTSREVSPTIDPKNIQQEHTVKRTKRQYRKKKKKTDTPVQSVPPVKQELPTPTQTPIMKTEENTPSPISLAVEHEISSNLPNLESLIHEPSHEDSNTHCFKKSKTVKLERSMSLQPEESLPYSSSSSTSQHFKSIGLDRTMSIPMEFLESNVLSRSTTNTSSFDVCKKCGNDSCLCLESGHIDDFNDEFKVHKRFHNPQYGDDLKNGMNDNMTMNDNKNNNNNSNNVNDDNEFDVNFFIKSEFDDEQFSLMI